MLVVALGLSGWLPAEGAGPKTVSATHVVIIVAAQLEIYDGPAGTRIESLAKEKIELPVPVIEVGPLDWLKIRLEGKREVWIKGRAVKTKSPLGSPGNPASKIATTSSTRG